MTSKPHEKILAELIKGLGDIVTMSLVERISTNRIG
jgi:hypothetical protein